MDLSKMKEEEKLYLCKWYFRAGFACLPFVWLVNAVWFFNEAFRRPSFETQKEMKRYVAFSVLGATVWAVALIVWVYVFQTNRASWGQTGELISFIVPTGIK